MAIFLKRAYQQPSPDDGYRVLVERLWPRGISKKAACLDQWLKEAAPSAPLRRWYGHDSEKWDEFKRRYRAELEGHLDLLEELARRSGQGRVTFVYGSKEERQNSAAVLKEFIEELAQVRRAKGEVGRPDFDCSLE